MSDTNNTIIELSNPDYIKIIKDNTISYGGNQMWFSNAHWNRKDYILHNYGCGTIATADFLLYLALQNEDLQSPLSEAVLAGSVPILYDNYISYLYQIHDYYTKTRRYLAVLGPKVAYAINKYCLDYGMNLTAHWKWALTYYDMFDILEDMLLQDLPVILSIGPNTPKLWGKKGISFYQKQEINYTESESNHKPYYYKEVCHHVRGHYVVVTGIVKDDVAGKIMLKISSWGKQYYLDYEEYRDYIESASGTFTSSLIQVGRD